MTRGGLLAAAGLICLLGAPGTAPAATAIYPEVETLERFGYTSRHAYLNHPVTVRTAPDWFAGHVTRLNARTEDRTDELVSILARSKDRSGMWWLRVRLPIRPNGSTGWVPRIALGEIRRVDSWLKVDRGRFRLQLLRRGRIVFQARVGVGQVRWPTPRGTFYVRNRLAGAALGSMYGPLAFGTSARSAVLTDWPGGGVIGIHGTDRPGLLPGRVSHGCIRLRNADVVRLGRRLAIGTPVTIT
jgi:hypothetical protein